MGVTLGTVCELAADDGSNAAAPARAAPCRTRRRRTIDEFHFGTAELLSVENASWGRKYHEKRKLDVTPEPRWRLARAKESQYVIRKHAVQRLHDDLCKRAAVCKDCARTSGHQDRKKSAPECARAVSQDDRVQKMRPDEDFLRHAYESVFSWYRTGRRQGRRHIPDADG